MPLHRSMTALAGLALVCALPAWGQGAAGGHVPPPGTDPAMFKPLTEREGVVPWSVFAQVELVKAKDRYWPKFAPGVAALDKKEVKVQGFMMPLGTGEKQTHFVLAAMPQTCAFCMPGGPESMVEVRTKKPLKYSFEPVTVVGRLQVLKDDPSGIYYRISDGVEAN